MPPELTAKEQEQWIAATALVDKQNENKTADEGLANSPYEDARAGDANQPIGFQIPDIDSIAATVKK